MRHFISSALLAVSFYITGCQTSGTTSPDESSAEQTTTVNISSVSLNWTYQDSTYQLDVEVLPPLSHHNLQVFPLLINASITGRSYVTLEKALEKGMAIMKETSNVNELMLNNKSDEYIYIQSGDIVKGGKQDRTMQYDLVVAPGEKGVQVASFCVESGRWTNRGSEDVAAFSVSRKSLAAKGLKLAAKKEKNQSRVWGFVSSNQEKLSKNVSDYYDTTIVVNDAASISSYQLALENEDLDSLRSLYLDELQELLNNKDICGYAYAINGQFYGIDLYNNKALFDDLAEKTLESFVTEAITERDSFKGQSAEQLQITEVLQLHMGREIAEHSEMLKLNKTTQFETIDLPGITEFVTTDRELQKWLHINFIDESGVDAPSNSLKMNRPVNSHEIEIIERD